jgi:hypothetical protein
MYKKVSGVEGRNQDAVKSSILNAKQEFLDALHGLQRMKEDNKVTKESQRIEH